MHDLPIEEVRIFLFTRIRALKSWIWAPILGLVYNALAYRGDWLTIGGDSIVPLHPLEYLTILSSTSNPWAGFGSNLPPIFSYPPFPDIMLFAFFRTLSTSIYTANRLYVFVLSTLIVVSIYFLAVTIFRENVHRHIIGVVAAIAYIYNPLVYADTFKAMVFIELSIVQTGFIMFLAFSVKSFQTNKMRYSLFSGLAAFLMLSYPGISGYRMAFLAFVGYILIALYYLTQHLRTGQRDILKSIFKNALIAAAVALIVNGYWVVPFVQNAAHFGSFASGFQTTSVFNKYSTMVNTLRLMNSWSFYAGYAPYADVYLNTPFLIALTFIWPLLAFLPLFSREVVKSRKTLMIYVMTLLTILLLWGSEYSFAEAYMTVVNVQIGSYYFLRPFYNPSTISQLVLTLEYALLIGLSSSYAYSWLTKGGQNLPFSKRKIAAVSTVVLVVVLFVSSSWPVITGDVMRNWYKPDEYGVRIPDSYWKVGDYLENLSDSKHRTLLLPPTETYIGTSWGYQGTSQFYNLLLNVPLVTGNEVPYSVTSNKTLIKQVYSVCYTVPAINDSLDIKEKTEKIVTWQSDEAISNDASLQIDFNSTFQIGKWHQVELRFSSVQNWTDFTHVMISFSGQFDLENLEFGVGDTARCIGWWSTQNRIYSLVNTTLVPSEGEELLPRDNRTATLLLPLKKPDRSTCSLENVSSVWIQYFVADSSDNASLLIDKIQAVRVRPDTLYYSRLLADVDIRYLMIDLAIKDGAKDNPQLWLDMLNDSKYFKVIWQEDSLYIFENVISP
jgi:hypothetical protein